MFVPLRPPAPCEPTLLSVVSSCDSDSIAVSWRPSQGSDNYRVVAEAPDGSTLNCTTGATDCRIAGLRCGQRYSVYVVGVNAGCPGERSHATTLQTGEDPDSPIGRTPSVSTQRLGDGMSAGH